MTPLNDAIACQGVCPETGLTYSLPRTKRVEAVAAELMQRLQSECLTEGKMFGVLLAEDVQSGQVSVLQAYSGQLSGLSDPQAWVPAFEQTQPHPNEAPTLARLAAIRTELEQLDPAAALGREQQQRYQQEHAGLQQQLQQRRLERQQRRDQGLELPLLEKESQQDSRLRREFQASWKARLAEGRDVQQRLQQLGQERRQLSRTLQAQLHERLQNDLLQGQPELWEVMFPQGPPTGVGDCCAPKLLQEAARRGLRPLALAEFWWGPASEESGRSSGQFYGPCSERCQPILGLLLGRTQPLPLLYCNDDFMAVDKPSGLLSVPGRGGDKQESALTRMQRFYPEVLEVHRLDRDTSGVLLLARHPAAQVQLRRLLEQRQLRKVYQAMLERPPAQAEGRLQQPLAADPRQSGRYCVDASGLPSQTDYRQLDGARVLLLPHTGRSHQLRVHLAHELGIPIRGDRLYGSVTDKSSRLCLHAWQVELLWNGQPLSIEAPLPF